MYGADLKRFLREEVSPELYSMENETQNEAFLSISNPAERYFVYKSGNISNSCVYSGAIQFRDANKDKRIGLADCDRCELVQQMYRVLWKDAIEDAENSSISPEQGETMTSLQGTLNLAIKLALTEEDRQYSKGNISLAYYLELLSYSEGFLDRVNSIPGYGKFSNAYHTIGNFIPVPAGLNTGRSNFGKSDYWDLTLMIIKKWYDGHCTPGSDGSQAILRELLNLKTVNESDTAAVKQCEKWLWWFGNQQTGAEGWHSFIKRNYLEDFLDNAGEPIAFRPGSAAEVTDFFELCTNLIYKRGQRLVRALKVTMGLR